MDRKIIAILIAALAIRVALSLIIPVTGDAALHYSTIQYIAQTGTIPVFEWVSGTDPFWYPPLFHLIGAFFYLINPNLIFFMSAIFGTIGVYYNYKLSSIITDRKTTLYATIVAATLPLLAYHSGIGYVEMLLYMTSSASFYYYFAKRTAKSIFFAGLSALVHYNGLIVAVSLSLILFVKKENIKKALALLLIPLLFVTPWFIRNYEDFGSPIFPMTKGFYATFHSTEMGLMAEIADTFTVSHWSSLYLDFWVGAPNSGVDFIEKISSLNIPFIWEGIIPWVAVTLAFTWLAAIGFMKANKNLQKLAAIILVLSLGLTVFRDFARMLMVFMPFFTIFVARGMSRIKIPYKEILFALSILGLLAVPFAYAFTYKELVDGYKPFFEKVSAIDGKILAKGFHMIMFYSQKNATYFENAPNRVPTSILENHDYARLKYYVDYVCCFDLFAKDSNDQALCDHYKNSATIIDSRGFCSVA